VIVVVGLSFRTAPVEVRERFATSNDALPQVLARLASRPELSEVMFLSTAHTPSDVAAAATALADELSAGSGR